MSSPSWKYVADKPIRFRVFERAYSTSNLHEAYRQTLIWGGEWGNEDDNHVAQLYGGYIIPGSTIDDLHLAVSQWNTETNWPYHVMQHRIRGFGT